MISDVRIGTDHEGMASYRLVEKTSAILEATNSTEERRMYVAATDFLDALYVLSETLRLGHSGHRSYFSEMRLAEGGAEVIGLRYLRGPSVHQSVVVQVLTDRISEIFYDHYGMWAWARDTTSSQDRLENRRDYEDFVAGREIHLVVVRPYECLRVQTDRGADGIPDIARLLPFGARTDEP